MASFALSDWRNRLLGSARFRELAQKIPVFQLFARAQANQLFALCGGFIHSQILAACVRLEVFERLRDGPKDTASLAAELSLPADRAEHLFAAAAALELLENRSDRRIALGRHGAALLDNEAVLAMVRHHALLYDDLQEPLELFRGSAAQTRMARLWTYAGGSDERGANAEAAREYSELMAVSQSMLAGQILDAVSLRSCRSLLDIGGGSGAFSMAAARRWPHLDITLADLPAVADLARSAVLEAGLQQRIEVRAVDATSGSLPAGQDLVSLIRILHDHDDDRVIELLGAAHRALKPGGTLLVAEPMAGGGRAGRLVSAYFHVYLLAMGSGRPRTPERLTELLSEAGFRRIRRKRTQVPMITSVLLAIR